MVPEIGLPPNHPFLTGIVPFTKTIQRFWGTPMYGHLHLSMVPLKLANHWAESAPARRISAPVAFCSSFQRPHISGVCGHRWP